MNMNMNKSLIISLSVLIINETDVYLSSGQLRNVLAVIGFVYGCLS